MKSGCQCNYHKGQAAIRHYANQPVIVKSSRIFALPSFQAPSASVMGAWAGRGEEHPRLGRYMHVCNDITHCDYLLGLSIFHHFLLLWLDTWEEQGRLCMNS